MARLSWSRLVAWLRPRSLSARLLLPTIGLMLLALLGSTAAFVAGTARTSERLLHRQVLEDMEQIQETLTERTATLQTAAGLFANDPTVVQALGQDDLHVLTDRAVVLRDRFTLDLLQVYDHAGRPRVNLVTAELYRVSTLLEQVREANVPAVHMGGQRLLLLVRADLPEAAGSVVAGLDLETELRRILIAERLPVEVNLATAAGQVSTVDPSSAPAGERYEMALSFTLGNSPAQMTVFRQVGEIHQVTNAGLAVMVVSMIITTLLLIGLGYGLTRSVARPVQRLAETARQVARGDLRQRVPLRDGAQDEIAELSHTFNEMVAMVQSRTQQLQDEKNRQEALHAISTELSRTLDLDEILLKTLDLASMATGRSLGMILLGDPRMGSLTVRALLDERNVLRVERRVVSLTAAWALREVASRQKPLCLADVKNAPESAGLPPLPTGARAVVAVPLVSAETVVGVLLLTHSQVGFYDDDQVRLLLTLGSEVAAAIHNAQLYGYINDQAQRLAEMLIHQQEEAGKMRAILHSITNGVIVVGRNGRILLVNPAAEQFLGMRREELEGRHSADLPGLFRPGGVLAQDSPRFDLAGRFVSVHSTVVTTDAGSELGRLYVIRDVTSEVEAEQAKSEFISNISHELRTPLTSIKGYVDLILMGAVGAVAPEQERFLQVVRANSTRLGELIDSLLDVSRIEAGRLSMNPQPLSISDVVGEVADLALTEIKRRGQQLEVRVPPDLPPVQADRRLIWQVLVNLVSNAYKYTPAGGRITVSAYRENNHLYVSVADTGVGISPEDQQRLFTRFFRARNPLCEQEPGTGLGLAIAKSFIEQHGGQMGVRSELGVGSTFFFSLPLSVPDQDTKEIRPYDDAVCFS